MECGSELVYGSAQLVQRFGMVGQIADRTGTFGCGGAYYDIDGRRSNRSVECCLQYFDRLCIRRGEQCGALHGDAVRSGEFSWGGFADALADGIFWAGIFAFVSASVNAVKSACRSFAKNANLRAGSACTSDCTQLGQCFIAGTLVLTKEGLKPIEEIEVGDEVLAYEEETGEQAYKKVIRLFRNVTENRCAVTVGERANGHERRDGIFCPSVERSPLCL